jgi:hypothetical protein
LTFGMERYREAAAAFYLRAPSFLFASKKNLIL